ncbi:NAD(P)-binding protein [Cryphonectria parasitica EP155]|uniref:NAD(P)-binding protein n=1 Tax=Cryphonectria parasitica (strain ATCC 38755 / EP155) TaxID=660469 RepID=A0A9P4Y638_CRYP1|nr:NAD(P)-binding protein [Cryphonectria parasitica EP155]KAF3767243.1 NAD(P)-binding protein [Cryphonectria parasitica EP155]
MSLSGKVAIITGGSKGIGKAIAQRLASDGAFVVINFSSDAPAAEQTVKEIGADKAYSVQADVGSVDGVDKLVKATVDKFGKVDVVVPNAGIMWMKTVASASEADFDRMFALNVKGPYFLAQKAVPHMGPGGRIIFVSTGINRATTVMPPYTLYAATKGAIDQMTRTMAKDLASKGINVNAIAPGPTETELFMNGKSEALVEGIKKSSPFNRLGQPGDIANAVAFLCGQDSNWVAGQVLHTNGGAFV